MAWRLRLVPEKTNIDFFRIQWATFGLSIAAMVLSLVLIFTMGLNLGIDFRGGTTIRTDPSVARTVDAGLLASRLPQAIGRHRHELLHAPTAVTS